MSSKNLQTKWGQFIPLVTVFFFWGFVAASNDILIPVFKKAFDLTQAQSQFVSIAFLYFLYCRLFNIYGDFVIDETRFSKQNRV
jgi:fucose permease